MPFLPLPRCTQTRDSCLQVEKGSLGCTIPDTAIALPSCCMASWWPTWAPGPKHSSVSHRAAVGDCGEGFLELQKPWPCPGPGTFPAGWHLPCLLASSSPCPLTPRWAVAMSRYRLQREGGGRRHGLRLHCRAFQPAYEAVKALPSCCPAARVPSTTCLSMESSWTTSAPLVCFLGALQSTAVSGVGAPQGHGLVLAVVDSSERRWFQSSSLALLGRQWESTLLTHPWPGQGLTAIRSNWSNWDGRRLSAAYGMLSCRPASMTLTQI